MVHPNDENDASAWKRDFARRNPVVVSAVASRAVELFSARVMSDLRSLTNLIRTVPGTRPREQYRTSHVTPDYVRYRDCGGPRRP